MGCKSAPGCGQFRPVPGQFLHRLILHPMPALIGKDVGQSFEEDEGQDVIFVLGGVNGATYLTGGFPKPGFKGGDVELVISHDVKALV